MSPRVNLPQPRSLDDLTVGELRAVLAGGDESVTVVEAVAALHEANRVNAAHEIDLRAFESYLARRETRRAAALQSAAQAAHKRASSPGSPSAMAARQEARVDAFETFEQHEPLLDFASWVDRGRPDEYAVGVIRRAIKKAVTSELVN